MDPSTCDQKNSSDDCRKALRAEPLANSSRQAEVSFWGFNLFSFKVLFCFFEVFFFFWGGDGGGYYKIASLMTFEGARCFRVFFECFGLGLGWCFGVFFVLKIRGWGDLAVLKT